MEVALAQPSVIAARNGVSVVPYSETPSVGYKDRLAVRHHSHFIPSCNHARLRQRDFHFRDLE